MFECRYSGMCDTEMRDGECDGCGNFKHPDWFQDCIGYEPMPDVEALTALADEIDNPLRQAVWNQTPGVRREHIMSRYARRIREALGVQDA